MSTRYRISPEGRGPLSDSEVARHADAARLLYNYHRATRPLYKNPKVFIALVILVLLALLVSEALGPDGPAPTDRHEQVIP